MHGITKFCDLTPEEFKSQYTNYRPSGAVTEKVEVAPRVGDAQDVDWTGKYTTAVKDQKQCGSCWAFSATEQIETDVAFATGSLLQLSPQQITSCDHLALGCGGGNTGTAYAQRESNSQSPDPCTRAHADRRFTVRISLQVLARTLQAR